MRRGEIPRGIAKFIARPRNRGGLFREVVMTAEIVQFTPKPNPKLIEAQATEIMKRVNCGWLTEEQMAEYKAPKKDPD